MSDVRPFPEPIRFEELGSESVDLLKPLFRREWEEVGEHRDIIELDIDFALLDAMLHVGRAAIFAAKRGSSIVGYAVFSISHHPKYRRTMWAFGSGLWIEPSARGPRVSHRLLQFAEAELAKRGVQFIQNGSRIAHKSAGRVLASLGYEPYEIGWLKRVGEDHA